MCSTEVFVAWVLYDYLLLKQNMKGVFETRQMSTFLYSAFEKDHISQIRWYLLLIREMRRKCIFIFLTFIMKRRMLTCLSQPLPATGSLPSPILPSRFSPCLVILQFCCILTAFDCILLPVFQKVDTFCMECYSLNVVIWELSFLYSSHLQIPFQWNISCVFFFNQELWHFSEGSLINAI